MPSEPRTLLLSPVFEALEVWLAAPDQAAADRLAASVVRVGEELGLTVGGLRVVLPPLPDLASEAGDPSGAERTLRSGDGEPLGSVRIAGDESQASALIHALELLFVSARARARADRSAAQLGAVEAAVRGIGSELDHDRVLQLIVDRVRDLVQARYAAIGIVDAEGTIEQFITSGITDAERARIGALPRGHGLLGLIIRESRAYRVRDIATHPDRYGFPPNHPEMHSFLGVPVMARGGPVGRLYLTEKIGASEFSDEDQSLVEVFALHAGIAIENARLHGQVRRLAVVDERDRISRDMHDSVIQAIYAQTLALDDVPEMVDDDPDEARRRVDEAIDALHAVIRDIRNFIFGLRPVLLESGSLSDGLSHLATELRRNGGIDATVSVAPGAGSLEGLSIEVVAELLTVTREALSNIARHANARRASVTLSGVPDELRLEIADDGQGFAAGGPTERGHHGLANMRARSEALGGRFTVDSSPAGTRIIIALPRPRATTNGDDE